MNDARLFLEGRHRELEASLEAKMREASDRLEYERAARHRDTLRTVKNLAVQQTMASVGLEDQDYLAHHHEAASAALQVFQVREGKVQGRREFTFDHVDFDPGDFYATVLAQYYAEGKPPPEIYVPAMPKDREVVQRWLSGRRSGRVKLATPRRGSKRRLLDVVRRNAELAWEARFRAPRTHGVEALERLAETIGLDEPPFRIECFDVSNVQGTDSVASLVVWEGGKPKKSDYRSFSLRGVEGPDDVASIAEAVTRRYRRLIQEDRRLPDLVLIDGGTGQLGAAVRALAVVGLPTVPVVALAKREEEIYLQRGGPPVRLDRSDPALHLVQRIRDEAHRFAVDRHRRRRKRRTLGTELTGIRGVGGVTARKLLRRFGSVDGVRRAGREALAEVVGPKLAEVISKRYREPSSGAPEADERRSAP